MGEPAARKADLRDVVDGRFSAPLRNAAALSTARRDRDGYRTLDDPATRALPPRVTVEVDPGVEAEFPDEAAFPAKVAGLTHAVVGASAAGSDGTRHDFAGLRPPPCAGSPPPRG